MEIYGPGGWIWGVLGVLMFFGPGLVVGTVCGLLLWRGHEREDGALWGGGIGLALSLALLVILPSDMAMRTTVLEFIGILSIPSAIICAVSGQIVAWRYWRGAKKLP
jgi:hypothetical protein